MGLLSEPASPAGLIHIEVTDRYGTVAEIVGAEAAQGLRPRQRDRLDALAAALVGDMARILGSDEDHARNVAIAELTRLVADEAAYERVAERRGVLPL